MFSWLGKKMISHNMARLREGDVEPTLRLDARDIRFRFPGENSWATELEGRESLRAWLDRFVEVGLQIHSDEVVLKGFPWNQTVCVRGRDHLDAPDGSRVYENRYVIWGRLRWGLLREYEVYEDTERTRELDEYLGAGESPARP